MFRVVLLLAALGWLVGCAPKHADDKPAEPDTTSATPKPADAETTAAIRALVPDAASATEDDEPKGGKEEMKIENFENQSLTMVLLLNPPVEEPGQQDFRVFRPDVVDLIGATANGRKSEKRYSLINSNFITSFTCEVRGLEANGIIEFSGVGLNPEPIYKGRVEYTARQRDGKWQIEEFRLLNMKVRVSRRADGKWRKERIDG